jgi:hypothetical protein
MSKLQARNESIIDAPAGSIWTVITDINLLPKIVPGIISASGRMDKPGDTRTCEIINRGKKGVFTERLVELVPQQRTTWTLESDTLGMSKMLRHTRFYFHLEKVSDNKTKLTNETWYEPAGFFASIMNILVMRKMFSKAQAQILTNIKSLTEK